MIKLNGITQVFPNIKDPTLKEFTKDKFINGNLYDYYKEFFERLEFVDNIIEILFKENHYHQYIINDSLSFEFNKELFEKFTMIAATVFHRMQREHNEFVKIDIDVSYNALNIDYNINPKYNKQNQYAIGVERLTGKSTRNINNYIQLAYQRWLVNDNSPIDIIDHFSFDRCMYDNHFRGMSISGPNQANYTLFNKLSYRMHEEFPKSILDFVQFSKYKLSYNLPKMTTIDYMQLE